VTSDPSPDDLKAILSIIRTQAAKQLLRISQHAHREMVQEAIVIDEVFQAIADGQIIEHYPSHRRGACCLLYGKDHDGRDIHMVCTTGQSVLIIVTVYLPKPPKWISPIERSKPS
jgi:Domain of unknown function (DUF4258)